jgi:methionine synthase II (cobalamin-independent)
VKKIAMNAAWQAQEFAGRGYKPIIFIDEPGLAGFGTSAFITITREDVQQAVNEVVEAVHSQGGIAGVHVCANTEWDLLLASEIDIISFDAYAYFDNFILFPDVIKEFLGRGGILAWGIVPTQNPEEIAGETVDSLMEKFEGQVEQFEKIGVVRETLLNRLFITPSCGTGSIDLDSAKKVLTLTKRLSERIRQTR